MERGTKHRLLLSLRAERAMGLKSVKRSTREVVDEDDVPVKQTVAVAKPQATAVATRRSDASSQPTPKVVEKSQPKPSIAPQPTLVSPSLPPFATPVLSTEQKKMALAAMDENEVRGCTLCDLCKTRTQTVFGEGDPDAEIFFIGEGPGENEDLTGRPFVGKAGQLLDKMILGMGLQREQVFIANIVKCRPPNNRVPAPVEVDACTPYLMRQLEIVRPKVIVTLGRPSACYMLSNPKMTMGSVRGQWQNWRGIPLMPTFHPSYVLRVFTEEIRRTVWSDLKAVLKQIGREPPKRDRVG